MQSGQNGGNMSGQLNNLGRPARVRDARGLERPHQGGEVPPAPPRPQGRERNVVISMWDWADPKAYLHDEVSSDKRNPRVNANGPVYGSLEASVDYLTVLDPNRPDEAGWRCRFEIRKPRRCRQPCRSPRSYWGDEATWTSRTSAHSFAMDGQGRVWTAQKIRPNETPEFCRPGSSHPSAAPFPIKRERQAGLRRTIREASSSRSSICVSPRTTWRLPRTRTTRSGSAAAAARSSAG